MRFISGIQWTFPQIFLLKIKISKNWDMVSYIKNNDYNDINIFLWLENPFTFCLRRKRPFLKRIFNNNSEILHYMKIRIFVLRKFVKRTKNILFSLVFVCFCFMEISYFLNFPSNQHVRKQHLSANAYSCINMKFSHTIVERKDETFYVVLLRKQAIFHLRLGQFFVVN